MAKKEEPYSIWFGPAILLAGIVYLFHDLGHISMPVSLWTVLVIIVGIKLMRRYERHLQ